jgi:2-iminoacetate synthase
VDDPDKIREVEEAGRSVLRGGRLSLDRARRWLAGPAGEIDGALQRAAREITDAFHGRRIFLFAPLYYASVCVNNCLYCGFRSGNPNAARRVLDSREIEIEAETLLRMGHRRVLLVASEDPSRSGRDLLLQAARAVRRARVDGASVEHVGMEVAPGDRDLFRAMSDAGVDSYTLFQETYDRKVYSVVHPHGPKRDYDRRIDAPSRALSGGIGGVGLGVLLGLADPRKDVIALIRHARRIERVDGVPPRTISLPRVEPADGSDLSHHPFWAVADETLLRLMAVIRIALPRTGIVLSSREPAAFRDCALDWGITEMSAGSRADPGGYAAADACALAQFELHDRRSPDEVVQMLRQRGYEPHGVGDEVGRETPAA